MEEWNKQATPPEEGKKFAELLREPGELPAMYGHTRLKLVPLGPYLVHVYWEVDPREYQTALQHAGSKTERCQPTLRFYDITDLLFDGTNAHSCFDVDIDVRTGSWYVHLWSPERVYVVDLGIRSEDLEFIPITRSNVGEIPSAMPAAGEEKHRSAPGEKTAPANTTPHASGTRRMRTDLTGKAADPEVPRTGAAAVHPAKPDSDIRDLTELSERLFARGLTSSGSGRSGGS